MPTHPTPDAASRPAPRLDRAAHLDRLARDVCVARVAAALQLPRAVASPVVHDVIDEYLSLTGGPRC